MKNNKLQSMMVETMKAKPWYIEDKKVWDEVKQIMNAIKYCLKSTFLNKNDIDRIEKYINCVLNKLAEICNIEELYNAHLYLNDVLDEAMETSEQMEEYEACGNLLKLMIILKPKIAVI